MINWMTFPRLQVAALLGASTTVLLVPHSLAQNPTPTQPPLKVRGGAMTFRYKASGWGKDASGNPCVPFDTTGGATLKIFADADPDDASPTNIPLSSGWEIDLHGRNDKFASDPNEGIALTATASCSTGTVNGNGIVMMPLRTATYSGFYTDDASVTDDGDTSTQRYKHKGCKDEDACEHMGQITGNSAANTPFASVGCTNGECLVKIVFPSS